MNLIDIGVNLTGKSFAGDRDKVVGDALSVGVSKIMITGTTLAHSRKALELANGRPDVLYATAGIHPHHASEMDENSITQLAKLAESKQIVAIGECGLDFNRNFSPRDSQLECYERQLQLAARCGLPVFLHQRDAHDDFIQLLIRYRDQINGGVVHCFTGNRQELHACLDLDMHIGITGWICDERRGKELQQIVKDIPLDRLMLETDAPYLLPHSIKPRPKSNRNEPKFLPYVCEAVAARLGRSAEEVAEATTETATQLFALG